LKIDAFSIPAARGITFRSARRSKSILFLMILIENRCFFDPGRSRDRLPIAPALEIRIQTLPSLMNY